MATIRTILVPTDLSDLSRASILHAVELAKTFGAKLQLVNVVEENLYADYSFAGGLSNPPAYFEKLIEERLKKLKEFSGEIPGDIPKDYNLRRGTAASEIIAEAQAVGADLIVIASHGRTGFSHLFLGSVAERVVRESTCPVLTVKSIKTVKSAKQELDSVTASTSPA